MGVATIEKTLDQTIIPVEKGKTLEKTISDIERTAANRLPVSGRSLDKTVLTIEQPIDRGQRESSSSSESDSSSDSTARAESEPVPTCVSTLVPTLLPMEASVEEVPLLVFSEASSSKTSSDQETKKIYSD